MVKPVSIFSKSTKANTLSKLQLEPFVQAALLEDLREGDVTTDNLPKLYDLETTAVLHSRSECVVSGLMLADLAFKLVDPQLDVNVISVNGKRVSADDVLMTVEGSLASILKAERTALNFLQHCCGIATETRKYVDAIQGTKAKITNTRKTTPGLRLIERQSVIDGGASPHRFNLGSAVMLKDNHLTGVSITEAVQQLRQCISHTQLIEVEADTLEQAEEAVEAGADIILLDNMPPPILREALAMIAGRAVTEASGNINLDTVKAVAETGVDYISTSKITLGAPAVDIGLDIN